MDASVDTSSLTALIASSLSRSAALLQRSSKAPADEAIPGYVSGPTSRTTSSSSSVVNEGADSPPLPPASRVLRAPGSYAEAKAEGDSLGLSWSVSSVGSSAVGVDTAMAVGFGASLAPAGPTAARVASALALERSRIRASSYLPSQDGSEARSHQLRLPREPIPLRHQQELVYPTLPTGMHKEPQFSDNVTRMQPSAQAAAPYSFASTVSSDPDTPVLAGLHALKLDIQRALAQPPRRAGLSCSDGGQTPAPAVLDTATERSFYLRSAACAHANYSNTEGGKADAPAFQSDSTMHMHTDSAQPATSYSAPFTIPGLDNWRSTSTYSHDSARNPSSDERKPVPVRWEPQPGPRPSFLRAEPDRTSHLDPQQQQSSEVALLPSRGDGLSRGSVVGQRQHAHLTGASVQALAPVSGSAAYISTVRWHTPHTPSRDALRSAGQLIRSLLRSSDTSEESDDITHLQRSEPPSFAAVVGGMRWDRRASDFFASLRTALPVHAYIDFMRVVDSLNHGHTSASELRAEAAQIFHACPALGHSKSTEMVAVLSELLGFYV